MVDTALVLLWLSGVVGLSPCLLRLLLRKWRKQAFKRGDYLTFATILCLAARLSMVHIISIWGTTATTLRSVLDNHLLSPESEQQIVIASKLLVCNRLVYTCFLWSLKLVIFDFCFQIISGFWWTWRVVYFYYAVFILTFMASILTAVLECRPFGLSWQLRPDPGNCVSGDLWLMVYGVFNIITDLMLMAIPICLMIRLRTSLLKKIQLISLFSLGFLAIPATVARIIFTSADPSEQTNRNIWTAIEVIVAMIVTHTPVIYTLLRAPRDTTTSRGQRPYGNDITRTTTNHRNQVPESLTTMQLQGDLSRLQDMEAKAPDLCSNGARYYHYKATRSTGFKGNQREGDLAGGLYIGDGESI